MKVLHLIPSLVAVLILLVGSAILRRRQRREWVDPAQRLLQLSTEARAGQLPIEELRSSITGNVAPLASLVADLLHDLRHQQLEHARLDAEMGQRIANRTEALERTLSSLKNQSQRDPLTGLYNRRAFDLAFPRVLEQCRAGRADLYVFMIDLDRFKHVNDTLGHLAGDALIANVGQLIRSHVRVTDFAFRYGGDEFVILLPGATFEFARALADRLSQLGSQLGSTLKLTPSPGLSIGMSSLGHNPEATPADLVKVADEALYANKSSRRSA